MLEDLRAIADEEFRAIIADEAMRNRFLAACGAQSVMPKKANGALSASVTSIVALSIMVVLLLSAPAPRGSLPDASDTMLDLLISQLRPAASGMVPPAIPTASVEAKDDDPGAASPSPSAYGVNGDPEPAASTATPAPGFATGQGAHALYPIKISGKYGYMNAEGDMIISPRYDEAGILASGAARVSVVSEAGARYGLIFDDGTATDLVYSYIGTYDQRGYALALSAETGLWGFIDVSGAWLVSPELDEAEPFADDRAHVTYQGEEGVIDRAGVFTSLADRPDPSSAATSSLPALSLDPGKTVVYVTGERIVFAERAKSLMGVVDASGNIVIPCMYASLVPVSDGGYLYGVVGQDGRMRYGMLSGEGSVIISHDYEYLSPCPGDGAYTAKPAGTSLFGLLDRHGAWILSPDYAGISFFDGILASVERADDTGTQVHGYVDVQGAWIRMEIE